MWYYQYVENRRPGWLGLFPLITPNPEYANVGRVLDQALAGERPVYLIKRMDGMEIKADLTALPSLLHAQLFKAAKPNLTPTQAVNIVYDDNLIITGYDLSQNWESGQISNLSYQKALTVTLYWQAGPASPAEDYTSYVHLLDAGGVGVTQSDHRPGGKYYPSSLWSPGEILRDTHTLDLPADLPPGEYTLIAGLYFQPENGVFKNLGDGQQLTPVAID